MLKTNLFFSVSPPPVVGIANGVAQSIVSLARGFGPLLGGYVRSITATLASYTKILTDFFQIWSVTVQGGPSGYYIGFMIVGVACALAVCHTFFIR